MYNTFRMSPYTTLCINPHSLPHPSIHWWDLLLSERQIYDKVIKFTVKLLSYDSQVTRLDMLLEINND